MIVRARSRFLHCQAGQRPFTPITRRYVGESFARHENHPRGFLRGLSCAYRSLTFRPHPACLLYVIHINAHTSGREKGREEGEAFEYLRISPRYARKLALMRGEDVGRRMTTGFGPPEFFISQRPEVPEQLFRLLLRPGVVLFCAPAPLTSPFSLFPSFLSLARALFLARDIS